MQHFKQVLSIAVGSHTRRQMEQLVGIDVSHAVGDLFRAGDHHTLAIFHRLDELGCLQQGFVGSGIQPGDPAPQCLYLQLPLPCRPYSSR